MFDDVPLAPADPILGLTEAFKKDPCPEKINLGVGVFTDASGRTPILACVREAEKRLAAPSTTRNYMPIDGDPSFRTHMQGLVFGRQSEIVFTRRAYTACAPGGTGSLRVAADFLKSNFPNTTVYLSNPTWPNHPQIFDAAGLSTDRYPWFDPVGNKLDYAAFLDALSRIPSGAAVLLHACCHNPTGIDPTHEEWSEIAKILSARGILPIVDFAYQGFGDGLEEDACGVRTLAGLCREMIVCNSCSKNFGLYADRVGSVTFVTASEETAAKVASQVKRVIRSNYSSPPQHGFSVVSTILSDPALSAQWAEEVAGMRARLAMLRGLFADSLAAKGIQQDFGFIKRQKGMFSFSGLTKDQVETLKKKYSIYIVSSGRVSVAGMNEKTMDRLASAIASVL
jgi:aspartate/tyrosine/aromatic aminotransferase